MSGIGKILGRAVSAGGSGDTTPAPKEMALQTEKLSKTYGGVVAVKGVDLAAQSGEFLTLLGPSGCGKSTLLRLIAGLIPPTEGAIRIGGRLVSDSPKGVLEPPEKRGIGMVFQSYALWPHMTVAQNVNYPLRCLKLPLSERRRRIEQVLSVFGLDGLGSRYPGELSGGQQQRVGLARAIAARPKLLLLDEPLSNLDRRLRESARVEIKRIHKELELTAVYVTHDQIEALSMSDRIGVMQAGEIQQLDTPENLYRTPINLWVARFLGIKSTLRGVLLDNGHVRVGESILRLESIISEGLTSGDRVVVAIWPDAVSRASPEDSNSLEGRITYSGYLGDYYEHEVNLDGDDSVTVHVREELGAWGDTVAVSVDPRRALVFREELTA